MLRNNFRTKLLCILAVPVAALIGITAFAGFGRFSDSRDASKLRHRIDIISAATDVAHQVQLEQAASADAVADPGAPRDQLVAQRATTDESIRTYFAAVQDAGDVGSTTFNFAMDRVRRNLNALATSYRGSVDLGSDINSVTSSFAEIGASVSDLIGTVADESSDASLAREASALAALSHGKDATAKEWAVLEVSLSRGAYKDAEEGTFRGTVADRDRWLGIHDGLATPASRSDLRTKMAGPAVATSDRIERSALAVTNGFGPVTAGANLSPALSAAQWHDSMQTRLDVMRQVLSSDIGHLADHASAVSAAATKDLQTFLLIALGAVLVSVFLGLVMARAVTTPLRQLTDAAEKLADEQLPALVNGLRNPGQDDESHLAATITPIEVKSQDEIGQLAQAFNAVQTVAVDVAAEQANLLRKGISEIFVNLARRNQVLIDRQIEFLDELEATEDDPDQLAQLYRLDHLATRMRRNAESLLVLAGIEPARTRTRPVQLFDVVRAAVGEVEDFSRLDLKTFEDIDVLGNAAVDLGHLLAELMDNAAHFSPPDTRVTIEGRRGRAGYVISITDSGIGMSEEQFSEANDLLSSPPPVGLALSRSLGFTVVARLAARYGVSVRLLPGEKVGTAAIVHLPQSLLLVRDADDAWAPADGAVDGVVEPMVEPTVEPLAGALEDSAAVEPVVERPLEPASRPALELVPDPVVVDPLEVVGASGRSDDDFESVIRAAWGDAGAALEPEPDERWAAQTPVADPPPATLRDAVPFGQQFERGLSNLVEGEAALGPAGLVEPPVPSGPSTVVATPTPTPEPASAPPSEPVQQRSEGDPSVTSAGLARRVRRTDNEYEGVDRFHAAPSGPSILATKRSPDDVRAMLARYRTGLHRGRSGDDPIQPEPGSE